MLTIRTPTIAPIIYEEIMANAKGMFDDFLSLISTMIVTAGLKWAPPAKPKRTIDRKRAIPIATG